MNYSSKHAGRTASCRMFAMCWWCRMRGDAGLEVAGAPCNVFDDGIWLVSFMEYDLGYIDLEEKTLQPLENPFGPKVLPMS